MPPKTRGGGGGASKGSSSRPGNRKPANKQPAARDKAGEANALGNTAAAATSHQQRALPFALQQQLLDVFGRALGPTLASPHLQESLQVVKRALFERDFAGAFGSVNDGDGESRPGEDVSTAAEGSSSSDETAVGTAVPPLEAYAARWSPTRALCYAAILSSSLVQEHWKTMTSDADDSSQAEAVLSSHSRRRMVAIGGGAAETVAFGAALLLADGDRENGGDNHGSEVQSGDLVLVDSGPWASVVDKLHGAMTKRQATTAPQDGRRLAIVQPAVRFRVDVRQLDILKVEDEDMKEIATGTAAGTTPTLVTLFFTLNELFTAGGIGAAATFLLRLTAAATAGTLLLVVDSPGNYAEAAVGTQARRYPMRWLLDKILLQDTAKSAGGANGAAWTKLHEDEAVWFRLPTSLVYPIRLEDMRYQIHLYVRK